MHSPCKLSTPLRPAAMVLVAVRRCDTTHLHCVLGWRGGTGAGTGPGPGQPRPGPALCHHHRHHFHRGHPQPNAEGPQHRHARRPRPGARAQAGRSGAASCCGLRRRPGGGAGAGAASAAASQRRCWSCLQRAAAKPAARVPARPRQTSTRVHGPAAADAAPQPPAPPWRRCCWAMPRATQQRRRQPQRPPLPPRQCLAAPAALARPPGVLRCCLAGGRAAGRARAPRPGGPGARPGSCRTAGPPPSASSMWVWARPPRHATGQGRGGAHAGQADAQVSHTCRMHALWRCMAPAQHSIITVTTSWQSSKTSVGHLHQGTATACGRRMLPAAAAGSASCCCARIHTPIPMLIVPPATHTHLEQEVPVRQHQPCGCARPCGRRARSRRLQRQLRESLDQACSIPSHLRCGARRQGTCCGCWPQQASATSRAAPDAPAPTHTDSSRA